MNALYGNTCDAFTGICDSNTPCSAGWKSLNCQEPCTAGSYGTQCGQTCGFCLSGQNCNHVTGKCPTKCSSGYQGDLCKDLCDPENWGINCENTCHCLNNANCDNFTGNCPVDLGTELICSAGYYGGKCNQECQNGTYGIDCGRVCSPYCVETCGRFDGSCRGECVPGWNGEKCVDSCSEYTFGTDCAYTCNCFDQTEVCASDLGYCETGCASGFTGDGCLYVCEAGFFGPDCLNNCGYCHDDESCHPVTGFCPEDDIRCRLGWLGENCKTEANCTENPCVHGGVCEQLENLEFICHCPDRTSGHLCEIGGCNNVTCFNGGICFPTDEFNSPEFRCICREGVSGDFCEIDPSLLEEGRMSGTLVIALVSLGVGLLILVSLSGVVYHFVKKSGFLEEGLRNFPRDEIDGVPDLMVGRYDSARNHRNQFQRSQNGNFQRNPKHLQNSTILPRHPTYVQDDIIRDWDVPRRSKPAYSTSIRRVQEYSNRIPGSMAGTVRWKFHFYGNTQINSYSNVTNALHVSNKSK